MGRFVYFFFFIAFYVFSPSVGVAKEISILVAGDVYLGSSAIEYTKKFGPSYPFGDTESLIKGADVAIANLESPLTKAKVPFMEKQFILKARTSGARGLKDAGFDVVTLANNHMMDYGAEGLDETLKTLSSIDMPYCGAGKNLKESRRPAIVEVNGVKIAVLSYSRTYPLEFYASKKRAGTAPAYESYIEEDIRAAAKAVDIVVVAFHWGGERVREPRQYQRDLGRLAIESGAKLVIGHHPHIMQGVETYKGGLILYSLGNFVFGFYGSNTVEGLLAKAVFEEEGGAWNVTYADLVPIDVNNRRVFFKPKAFEGDSFREAINKVMNLSKDFDARFDVELGRVWVKGGHSEEAEMVKKSAFSHNDGLSTAQ
ncbi:MAG: CapA family protein [Thermodesulfobacteriota bacterium]